MMKCTGTLNCDFFNRGLTVLWAFVTDPITQPFKNNLTLGMGLASTVAWLDLVNIAHLDDELL